MRDKARERRVTLPPVSEQQPAEPPWPVDLRRPVVQHQPRRFPVRHVAVLLVLLAATLTVSCGPRLTAEQKLSDFRYLFDILRDNHPYLALKARVEGYDWLEHEEDFEEAVRETRDDREFAEAIQRMLLLINNGHTTVMSPQLLSLFKGLPEEMKPWLDEAAKTDLETVNRWHSYAMSPLVYPKDVGLPFRAWYNAGEYLVYWVSEDLQTRHGLSPGQVIISVNGMPVHDFVRSLRGRAYLKYDPYRRRVYLPEFLPPYTREPYRVVFGRADPEVGTKVGTKVGPEVGTKVGTEVSPEVSPEVSLEVSLEVSPQVSPKEEGNAGGTVELEVKFDSVTESVRSPYLPTNIWSVSHNNIYTTTLAEGQVAYLHLGRMTTYESSQAEREALLSFFAKIKDLPALIIDIRNNGGGDDRFWMLNIVRPLATEPVTEGIGGSALRTGEYIVPFRQANQEVGSSIEGVSGKGGLVPKSQLSSVLTPEQLERLPKEVLGPDFRDLALSQMTIDPSGECPYHGGIFLLVGRRVFSSAEGFAQFCKSSGWATVVGEHTGGDGGGCQPVIVTLPNSRMPVFFPSGMGLNPDLTANEETHTAPDVLVEQDPEELIEYVQAMRRGKVFDRPDPEYDGALRECIRLAVGTADR